MVKKTIMLIFLIIFTIFFMDSIVGIYYKIDEIKKITEIILLLLKILLSEIGIIVSHKRLKEIEGTRNIFNGLIK